MESCWFQHTGYGATGALSPRPTYNDSIRAVVFLVTTMGYAQFETKHSLREWEGSGGGVKGIGLRYPNLLGNTAQGLFQTGS